MAEPKPTWLEAENLAVKFENVIGYATFSKPEFDSRGFDYLHVSPSPWDRSANVFDRKRQRVILACSKFYKSQNINIYLEGMWTNHFRRGSYGLAITQMCKL